MFRFTPFAIVTLYVALAVFVLRRLRIDVLAEAAAGWARAILQLLIMGSVLTAVFRVDSRLLDTTVLAAMIVTAALIASRRASTGGNLRVSLAAVFSASALVIVPMAVLGVFELASSFLIPISGMVIGNAMNSTALSLDRLERELNTGRKTIEARLALGMDVRHATASAVRESVTAALIPSLNTMKSMGVVHIPGLMTGMLLSGANPLHAAQLQAIIVYLIFIAAVISSVVATRLQRRTFFTPYDAFKPREGSAT